MEDYVNGLIVKGRCKLLIIHIVDTTSDSLICGKILKKLSKKGRVVFSFDTVKKLDRICQVLEGPGVIFVKDRRVLKCASAAKVVKTGVEGIEKLIINLERGYAESHTDETGVDPFFGFKMDPFSTWKESLEGEARDEKDAWLDSVVVTPRVHNRARVAAAQKLSDTDLKLVRTRLASHLLPGETVAKALGRLKIKGKVATPDEAIAFNEITEDATVLSENGQPGIYGDSKELIEQKAAEAADYIGGNFNGYIWDPALGYYHDAVSGWSYEPVSGYFAFAGIWYQYDPETMSHVPVPQ